MKNLFPVFIFFLILAMTSCTVEKRHYMKGFYLKKNKKVETSPNTTPQNNDTHPQVNNVPNQSTSSTNTAQQPVASWSQPKPPLKQPTFCFYGGLQEGLSTISLNAEKIFCFGPYVNCFARTGVGLFDVSYKNTYKKYIFSGGISAGTPILKLGGEIGYSGYFNGMQGGGFYDVFIRLIPGRKSVYLSASWWKAMNATEKLQSGFACGLGISF